MKRYDIDNYINLTSIGRNCHSILLRDWIWGKFNVFVDRECQLNKWEEYILSV